MCIKINIQDRVCNPYVYLKLEENWQIVLCNCVIENFSPTQIASTAPLKGTRANIYDVLDGKAFERKARCLYI